MSEQKHKKPLTKARKIYNIVSTIIVALVFIFLVLMVAIVLWQRSSGSDTSIFGYYLFDVVSDSMEDTIKVGDVILCKEIDDVNSLNKDDIITFTAPSGPLAGHNETHRIYSIDRNADGTINYIKTAGDNTYGGDDVRVDSWNLNPSAVKAKYVRTLPFIAGLRDFLSHWYGYVVLIALPLLIVSTLFIIGFIKDKTSYELEKAGLAGDANASPTLDNMSEEEKKKLLEEFLLSQPREDNLSDDSQSQTTHSADKDCETSPFDDVEDNASPHTDSDSEIPPVNNDRR